MILKSFLGVYGLECYKTQELYFELEMAKWNVGKNESNIPESICSKPCPMGQIKNFEVFTNCTMFIWEYSEPPHAFFSPTQNRFKTGSKMPYEVSTY